MKKITISKTVRIILLAGIFVVILAGLGFTRYQLSAQQATIEEELETSELRLLQFNNPILQEKLNELEAQLEELEKRTGDAYEKLKASVVSADVTEQFYQTAHGSYVHVDLFTSVPIAHETIADIDVLQTSISARVTGTLTNTIHFVENLNEFFITGYVTNARFVVEQPAISGSLGANTTLHLDFIIYTRDEGVQ